MSRHGFLTPLAKALRFYAVLALAILLLQMLGLGMYLVNVWPAMREVVSVGQKVFVSAVALGLVRSCVWIAIYWLGAKALAFLHRDGDSRQLDDELAPVLKRLTRLLVASCVLDFLFLPAFFLTDVFLPFSVSGWRLGLVELARLLFPQAFGLAALILAFLTSQYGKLLRERSEMKHELELTI